MSRVKRWGLNVALAVVALLVVFATSLAADRMAGRLLPNKAAPGALELIFPPGSHMEYATTEFTYSVDVNSLGYRDKEFASLTPGVYRIAAIGDSFTYGQGVNLQDTWIKQLDSNLRQAGLNVETINLGKPGTGTPFYAELAERAIPLLRPDLIIVGMLQADDLASADDKAAPAPPWLLTKVEDVWPNFVQWIRNREGTLGARTEKRPVHPPMIVSAADGIKSQAESAQSVLKSFTPEEQARYAQIDVKVRQAFETGNLNPALISTTVRSADYLVNNSRDNDPYFFVRAVDKTTGFMQRIERVAKAYHTRVLVVSIPMGCFVNMYAMDNYRRVGFRVEPGFLSTFVPDKAIRIVCERTGVPFLSITDEFRAHKDEPDLFFPMDCHPTPNGHKLMADLLTPTIRKIVEEGR